MDGLIQTEQLQLPGILNDTVADSLPKMRLFSYVVLRDYGFAPNPFYQFCTLCTCKPLTRRDANEGDWVVGTGTKSRNRSGYLVYAMRVTETMPFQNYWDDDRFFCKRPNMFGSMKKAFGDNIYHRDSSKKWVQEDSHHSLRNGVQNEANITNDTGVDRVLISDDYVYFGGNGPEIPSRYRNWDGWDVCAIRHHKVNHPDGLAEDLVGWIRSLGVTGYQSEPLDWGRTS